MPKNLYEVHIARVEYYDFVYEIEADSYEEARALGKKARAEDWQDSAGKCVDAEEFTNEVHLLEGEEDA